LLGDQLRPARHIRQHLQVLGDLAGMPTQQHCQLRQGLGLGPQRVLPGLRTVRRRWTPADEAGPLKAEQANTFRSASYDEVALAEDTLMYRVVTVDGRSNGEFWTREKPLGPLQAQLDLALHPEWKLRDPDAALLVTKAQATHYVQAVMPKGTVIYEGAAGPQVGAIFSESSLVGGGQQVLVRKVPVEWVAPGLHRLAP
jgi:hypothetical protein